jgi:hypothetical protein
MSDGCAKLSEKYFLWNKTYVQETHFQKTLKCRMKFKICVTLGVRRLPTFRGFEVVTLKKIRASRNPPLSREGGPLATFLPGPTDTKIRHCFLMRATRAKI